MSKYTDIPTPQLQLDEVKARIADYWTRTTKYFKNLQTKLY
ncbi:hypothetical protein VIBNISFn118_530023 [Vibrio nigripulchritudo SFn118]|nr:hypothetical protein VIBNISFn118_530023 [Vibrio nigripulchritudo SFn118]